MKDPIFKDKRCLVVDQGLFVSWAHRLAREFGEVMYHNPAWKQMSPRSNELLIGHGFDDIRMVKNLWDAVGKADLIVFPYIYNGDLQMELQRQGKRVWGSRKGEDLELYRPESKAIFKELGLPVTDYVVLTGITALRGFLKDVRGVWVKTSLTRADSETFYSPSYDEIAPRLRELERDLDEAAEHMDFLIEYPIEPAIEIGYDGWNIDGQYPPVAIQAVEVKDSALIGAVKSYEDLDEHVRSVNAMLQPKLAELGYRGCMSTEIRVGPDEKPYLIDFTARSGSPPGESMQEIFENWAEIMWYGADGIIVRPEAAAKYCAQAVICSDFAETGWQPVRFPDEYRDRVKLFFHCQMSGLDYVIPQHARFSEIGWVIGLGDTVKEAIQDCEDVAEQVSGFELCVKTDELHEAAEEIEKGEQMGVSFT